MPKRFIVRRIKLDKMLVEDFTNLIVDIAMHYPNQANKLLKRYLAFACHGCRPKNIAENFVIRGIRSHARERGKDTYKMLSRTVPLLTRDLRR
jgi:hypothetical protein